MHIALAAARGPGHWRGGARLEAARVRGCGLFGVGIGMLPLLATHARGTRKVRASVYHSRSMKPLRLP